MKSKTIVVKLGTNSITNDDASLNLPLMKELVAQVAEIMKQHNVLFVSSGAMGAGRSILKKEMKYDETTTRQLYAVVGQVKLMEIYSELFAEHGINIAQMLATKQDFENRTHALNTKNCIESLFREGIIPIMNENDFVCIDELMFTDNDELAGTISKMLFASKLIILSNVDGVLDSEGNVIPEFDWNSEIPDSIITPDKSSFGKGGMQTKFKVAQSIAEHGVEVFIANSKVENVISRLVGGEKFGTIINPK
jgi:glutamate 5-kinase